MAAGGRLCDKKRQIFLENCLKRVDINFSLEYAIFLGKQPLHINTM